MGVDYCELAVGAVAIDGVDASGVNNVMSDPFEFGRQGFGDEDEATSGVSIVGVWSRIGIVSVIKVSKTYLGSNAVVVCFLE